MNSHNVALNTLLHAFVRQLELLCGQSLYVEKLTGQRWGIYKYPGRKTNICNAVERSQRDADFPSCPLPHLKIVTDNAKAQKRGSRPALVIPDRWHGHDAAYWCISRSGSTQFQAAAREVSKLC